MENIEVKIVNKSNNPLPEYARVGDAGLDIRAYIDESVILKPGERKLIPTGIYIQMPYGIECQVRPRSGLALKHGITVCNTPGTVDPNYRGEVGVILINLGQENFTVNSGDRIAQLVFARYTTINWKVVDKLDSDNDRGGGFGHTGVK